MDFDRINQLKAEMESIESKLGALGPPTNNNGHTIQQAPGYPSSEYQALNSNPPAQMSPPRMNMAMDHGRSMSIAGRSRTPTRYTDKVTRPSNMTTTSHRPPVYDG